MNYKWLYETDEDVKAYVDRYANQYKKTIEQALEDKIVKIVIDEIVKGKKYGNGNMR